MPLVGFAQSPADSRSSCIAVLSETPGVGNLRPAVEACRHLGTPIVFVCLGDRLQWWKQGVTAAELLDSVQAHELPQFFEDHRNTFSPQAVYRAKTWGRYRKAFQLSFVDLGLMPVLEKQVGESLGKLVTRNVEDLKDRLEWSDITDDQGQWLIKAVFWLLSAKILHDKNVKNFEALDLLDIQDVFRRLAKHYGTVSLAMDSNRLNALSSSARDIGQFSSLALTTTESLTYVYETTLISKETRSSLGTHATPSFLVDYIVGNLADWIAEIPADERSVFEPACGQAAFLVSAMRLLTEMLPAEDAIPVRRGAYLRSRLHGTDIDAFALELARLSLTLTDIPNPDGWDLVVRSMFAGDHLAEQAKKNTILLANPPFENFKPHERQESEARFINKSAEMLWRTLPQLPGGGIFGVVVPQTMLHSSNTRELREFLLRDCELKEVCLFPDRVFTFSDAESAILIGRRKRVADSHTTRYRRIRERGLSVFHSDPAQLSVREVPKFRFCSDGSFSLRLPELEEVWNVLAANPALGDTASVGRGLEYRGADLPSGLTTHRAEYFPDGYQGFVRSEPSTQLHELPTLSWMNLNPEAIRRSVNGADVGIPQVLLNYARASRGPWRLKALIDERGHPVTSAFVPVRPTDPLYSLEVLWAVLNSPVANAYAFSHLGKRHNIVGDIRRIPLPKVATLEGVQAAAISYLLAAGAGSKPADLQRLLLKVDCEVLKLYSLSLELEQSLLSLFTGWPRVGVPFTQDRYLPEELEGRLRLSEFLEFEADWLVTNRERGILIDKSISGALTPEEQQRLDALQIYADYHLERIAPRPTHTLDEIERRILAASPAKARSIQ